MHSYTVVVTSCDRFDLLERTLRSLLPRLDGNLADVIVIEDSGDPAVHDVAHFIDSGIRVLLNEQNLGQLASIDRAYAQVKTEYIFHCEDDWTFTGDGFIEPSFVLLEQLQHVSMVGLRPRQELNPRLRDSPTREIGGIRYFEADPAAHPEYFGYSFNPGLRRLRDYRRLAPLADLMGEREISYCFKRLGLHMAYLEEAAVTHAGHGRHVDDAHEARRPTNRLSRLRHSARLRLDRLRRLLLPHTDAARQILTGTGPIGRTRLDRIEGARHAA